MNITKKYLLDQSRKMCLKCQGQLKMREAHCAESDCPLYPARVYMIEQSQQLSIFTYAGFLAEYENILAFYGPDFLNEMYYSEIREKITEKMKLARNKLPEGNGLTSWWSNAAKNILPKFGWSRRELLYRWTSTGGKDYLYRRVNTTSATAEAWNEDMKHA